MADIFLSYARSDFETVQDLAEKLEECGSVFWDKNIRTGEDWRRKIEAEVNSARCVVVAWSRNSVESTWVRDEVDRARKIFPVFIEDVKAPMGYGNLQGKKLCGGNTSIGELIAEINEWLNLQDPGPVIELDPEEQEDHTWKAAYSLLRLDQLPRGGWSRSLPQWMELIWEGEHGTVFRSPAMKDDGGDDSAGYAVHLLSQFASRVYCNGLDPNHGIGHALQACAMAFQKRVGRHGGLDEGTTSRGEPPPIKVRHTLVGLLAHLNCERMDVPGFEAGVDSEVVDYLLKVIPTWTEDKSHLFGMYASAVALWRVLGELPADSL